MINILLFFETFKAIKNINNELVISKSHNTLKKRNLSTLFLFIIFVERKKTQSGFDIKKKNYRFAHLKKNREKSFIKI
tara:strand:+ start:410 stop:643 length:234 start_codon:yes stop_codon:yes gene_type:complete